MNIPTATLILTGTIGCVTSYIAVQQWLTAKNKLRLDLFDRRFPVFEATMKLVSIAIQKGDIPDEARRAFLIATRGAQFLFDQKLQDYCDVLAKEAISVRVGEQMMDYLPVGDRRTKSAEAWAERMEWFTEQMDEIPKRFAPFLKIHG